MQRAIVIGLGNPDCGDDGVGRLVARLLRHAAPDLCIEEQNGSAAELIERLRDAEAVLLVDAAASGASPGTLHVIDCNAGDTLPLHSSMSSHGVGVVEAIGIARALGSLPNPCWLYAIEGAVFAPGAAMSAAVQQAAAALVVRLAIALHCDAPLNPPA